MSNGELSKYFEALREIKQIDEYEQYLMKIIRKAEKDLDLEELGELAPHIRVIIKKTVELRDKKKAFENMISSSMPKYRKLLTEFNDALNQLIKLKSPLIELVGDREKQDYDISKSDNRLWELRDALIIELKNLKSLREKEDMKVFRNLLDEEIKSVETAIKTFDSMNRILTPNLDEIKRARSLLGYDVIIENSVQGYVGGVYYVLPDFSIVLRIYKESSLSETDLQAIHKHLYNSLIISSTYEEFRRELLDDLKRIFGVDESQALRPSILRIYFKMKNFRLPIDIVKQLKPQIKTVGYIYFDDITEINEANKVIVAKELVPPRAIEKKINLPSISPQDKSLIGKQVLINYLYNYVVYNVTWLPNLGMSAILLRRDLGNIPIPSPEFVKKILMYIETKNLDFEKQSEEKETITGDLYWKLRVLVMKTLNDMPDITENKALQPKYIFEFALRKNIPILFSEIFQTYFVAIPIDVIRKVGETLITKIPIDPIPVKHILNKKEVKEILGTKCEVFLGLFVRRNDGILIECCDSLTDNIKKRLKREFKLEEKFFEAIKGDVKKLIRSLILSGLINTKDKYNTLLTILNKKEIKYDDIVEPLYRDLGTLLRLHLLKNIQ